MKIIFFPIFLYFFLLYCHYYLFSWVDGRRRRCHDGGIMNNVCDGWSQSSDHHHDHGKFKREHRQVTPNYLTCCSRNCDMTVCRTHVKEHR